MSSKSSTSLPRIESRFATSSTSSNSLAIASERWNVEKKRVELDEDIEKFYNAQVAKCLSIDKVANERITKLYNDIYYKVKWSNPPLPGPIQTLFTNYGKHLLTEGPKAKFPSLVDLKVWQKKVKGSIHEKAVGEIDKQCKVLRDVILKRDTDLIETQATLLSTTEKKNVKKDGALRWMMEKNVGKKDEYFTIWYLAANCKIRELDVLLNAPSKQVHIDQRDPDFGLTPLHYACKSVKLSMVQYLMSHGADLTLRTPDGRTPLHLAAAYSTREVVLELLGACIDYDATDNYGCTALQMAVQNRNTRTMELLSSWNDLTLLPEELAERAQQKSLTFATTGLLQEASVTVGFESVVSKLSPSRGAQLATSESMPFGQSSVYVDPNIPEEYQPIPSETIKLMSPTLSLLTKRLNAYNMYFTRNETNYIPTEMLRSRDLSNISEMLHRSAALAESMAYGQSLGVSPPTYSHTSSNDLLGDKVDFPHSVDSFIYTDNSISQLEDTRESIQPGTDTNMSVIGENINDESHDFSFRSIFNNQVLYPDDIFQLGSSHMEKNDFGTLFNECLVEIRLVSKHYALCVQENLIAEAMRSLRRRWLVAKRLWDLILQEKRRKTELEVARRLEQERDMEALLTDQENYNLKYDETGAPVWSNAGLLENSSSVLLVDGEREGEREERHSGLLPVKQHPQLLENSSELATRPSPPRLQRNNTSMTSTDHISVAYSPSQSRGASSGPDAANAQFNNSNLDINPNIPTSRVGHAEEEGEGQGQEDQEGEDDESDDESSQYTGSAPVDLERIARVYEELLEANRLAENNPDIENQSSSTVRRPAEYDSIGIGVYKVKDNVYWETESSHKRMHAPPLSASTSDGGDAAGPSSGPGSVEQEEQAALGAEAQKILSFVPDAAQESNAWDVIQKWQGVAHERMKRKPNFDIYNSNNDEVMSTTSLLTFSVTEAPSSGGFTAHSPSGLSRPDSPSGSSINSASYMLTSVQQYSYASGPFKENVRGNYVIKLGMDLVNVYLARKEEGQALRILHECCVINDEVEVTQKISLLERKTDLLLHIHDSLERALLAIDAALLTNGRVSRPKMRLNVPMERIVPSVRTILTDRVQAMMAAASWVQADLARRQEIDKQSGSYLPDGGGSAAEPVEAENSADYFTILRPQASYAADDTASECHNLESQLLSSTALPMEQLDSSPSLGVTFSDPVDDKDAIKIESAAAIERIREIQKNILAQCVATTDSSVSLHREHYKTDIAEPSSLAVALMQRARVEERDCNGAQAMEFTEAAEVAAVRALGGGSQLAISIMLESLRLYIKYQLQDNSDLKYVNARSHEINKYIVQFSFTDINMADKFTQKCFEYLSICTIAVKKQQEEAAAAAAAIKLAEEREARRKIVEAQASIRKSKR